MNSHWWACKEVQSDKYESIIHVIVCNCLSSALMINGLITKAVYDDGALLLLDGVVYMLE